jgi:hypothetical protein
MPMWGGSWGGTWAGFGWVFPVIALLFMAVMMFLCFRRMGRMGCRGHEGSGRAPADTEVGDLRREVQQLREEVRRLRARE